MENKHNSHKLLGRVQVYTIWVNGRAIEDTDQHFAIDCDLGIIRDWTDRLSWIVSLYSTVEAKRGDGEYGSYTDIFEDYHVALYSIDIDVADFEAMFDLDFDLKCDEVQDMIPYYVDYDFNVVAERIAKFN